MEQLGATIPPTGTYGDKYTDQVVLVTGGGNGIGHDTATLFADQGGNVVLVDLDEQRLRKVEASFTSEGKNVPTESPIRHQKSKSGQ
ncbi:uncharacterized protein Z519_06100 [Cladophialophora bantiana CBS 173.52]|uniref:Uncharacterized protein n=1 Tax=Cladophialophora bantiana (strain ATCC 10958 / CBS 173.52 / CDC B-1940 / NIH 8579) TaxID=1442370 RepID=A0A0D2HRP5_CLAB1|nr:uncharacterized protein Z519_06100 [Cladophialophora bantiana CBS 173.52]KIW93495.1 hypothetical protein Z519_06100 [Cladophialophora bantiana CBS 173.52]